MVTNKKQAQKRGRPRGRTATGEETRERLYSIAIELMAEQGFQGTTLRQIATEAGVSHALLYKYFPSKQAVVLALYERLSADFVARSALRSGPWRKRGLAAMRNSLQVLAPHRETLRGAISVLVSTTEEGLFSRSTRFSLERVSEVFEQAVAGASDAPSGKRAKALGRLLYLAHLGVILTWLLDRSPGQKATKALMGLMATLLTFSSAALRLPGGWRMVERADVTVFEALLE